MIYAFLSAVLALIASTVYDIRLASRGIAKGLSTEANPIIVHFFGSKPTALHGYTVHVICSLPMVASGVLGLQFDNPGLIVISIAAMIAYSARHIQGAREWAKLGA